MAFATQEFLNITSAQQVTDMAAFINANKPNSLSSVNVSKSEDSNFWYLQLRLYTAISNYGRVYYQISDSANPPCYFNIVTIDDSRIYMSQALDYIPGSGNAHNANFRIVCSDNCIAVIYWPTLRSNILTTHVMVITTDNHGEVCVFYNSGSVFNNYTGPAVSPGILSTLTKDGDTTAAQYRVVSMNFREDSSSTYVQPPVIGQTMLFNLPIWNNSQNDIRYMPHVFMASCVDQLTGTGSIVTVGDHEYYCCLLSRIFFD